MANSFYDLNVPIGDSLAETAKKIERLAKFGYQVVALSKVHVPTNKRKRVEKKSADLENDDNQHKKNAERILHMVTEKPAGFKLLTRITVLIDNPDQVRCLQQDYIRSFDIVAVRPTNDKIFQQACTQMEHVDIISLDIEEKIPFKIKYSMVGAAIERGIFIELSYAPAIRSASLRRNVLSNSVNLVKYCKAKGIILTSNGEHFMELRCPKDIINLASMFGLKGSQANDSISQRCRDVVLHAYARLQTAKSVITMKKVGTPISIMEEIVKGKAKNGEKYSSIEVTPVVKQTKQC